MSQIAKKTITTRRSLHSLTRSLVGLAVFVGMELTYRLYIRAIVRRNLGISN